MGIVVILVGYGIVLVLILQFLQYALIKMNCNDDGDGSATLSIHCIHNVYLDVSMNTMLTLDTIHVLGLPGTPSDLKHNGAPIATKLYHFDSKAKSMTMEKLQVTIDCRMNHEFTWTYL